MDDNKKSGVISVMVQTQDRLKAILNLSSAIRDCAKALASNVKVTISDCNISSSDIGVLVNTEQEVDETKIERF